MNEKVNPGLKGYGLMGLWAYGLTCLHAYMLICCALTGTAYSILYLYSWQQRKHTYKTQPD